MGLEGIEILMDVEDTFGIAIPDEDAQHLASPLLLLEYVAARVPLLPRAECRSQRIYYQLRRGLSTILGIEPHRVLLSTSLDALTSREAWGDVWRAVRTEVGGLGWPESVGWPGRLGFGPRRIRELVWRIAAESPRPIPGAPCTRDAIEVTIREIISEHSGVLLGFQLRRTWKELGIN